MWWVAAALAVETWQPEVEVLVVRQAPAADAALRGRLVKDEPFAVQEHVDGPGCADWGKLGPEAFACLDFAQPTQAAPVHLPRPVAYEPPWPEEYAHYRATGERTRSGQVDPTLLPFVYARRLGRFKGRVYADAEAWSRGDGPVSRLAPGARVRFVGVLEHPGGTLLLQDDGTVVPEDDVYVFPIDRFQGEDLARAPIPEGHVLAWSIDYEGAGVFAAPVKLDRRGLTDVEPERRADYHQRLDLLPHPDPHWWVLPDGLGPGVPGYVEDVRGVKVFAPGDTPADLVNQRWIDIDVESRTLALMQGDEPRYVTLTAPGKGGLRSTRPGRFAIADKSVWWDMDSRPGAAEPYHVEAVPWTMHYAPRYAIHAAYWHWGVGHPASHGCVNLAPRDARWLFEHIAPALPAGWHTVEATEADPGTPVRIR